MCFIDGDTPLCNALTLAVRRTELRTALMADIPVEGEIKRRTTRVRGLVYT